MRIATVAVLVILSVICCNGQKFVETERLNIITTLRNGVAIPKYLGRDTAYVLARLQPGRLVELKRAGFETSRTLENGLVVLRAGSTNLSSFDFIIGKTQPINYLWKLADNLLSLNFQKNCSYVIQTKNPEYVRKKLAHYDLPTQQHSNVLIVRGDISSLVAELLVDNNVTYIGQESFDVREEGRVLDLYHGPNTTNKLHHHFPELNGEEITVSIKERQFNAGDIDLLGRTIASTVADEDTSNHATEMATIVAGAGNSFITGRGVATHARLHSSSFENLFPDQVNEFIIANAFLQNHAYGTTVENSYGALANAYDVAANQQPKILHVFSSGNAGTSAAASGKYVTAPGYSNLTGNSKMAKNILVVGSVDTTGNAIPLSSRGPANDGRIKPEMVAYSTAGTSNSAAMVSGVAAVMQQAYKSKTGTYPDAALLKAILINAADDVGAPGIDFISGFGNLDAYRSVDNLVQNRFFQGDISNGEIKSFEINVPGNARNVKVTLVWNDPAAVANSSSTLVNNLDLRLRSSGEIIHPWILDSSPTTSNLAAPALRGVDNINNVEQVTLEQPSPEVHHIEVHATSLSSTQKFFVAYQWDEDETFTWNYPTASDNFPYNGETGTYFYWNSTRSAAEGDLEVTINNGSTWIPIAKKLDLKKGYYRWQNPFAVNASAKARMVIAGVNFETDEFTISRTLIPSVGFNCADSVLLQWPQFPEVTAYGVEHLVGNYVTPFQSVSDTLLLIDKNTPAEYFAVQPLLPNDRTLLRSPAVNISTYGAGCFISTFVDESLDESGILLRLELGTTYGVREIYFDHAPEGSNIFETVATIQNPTATVVRHLHTNPGQGLNRYRARVRLVNDQFVSSDTVMTYFLTTVPFIVFPNPVHPQGDLNIFSGKFEIVDFTFNLYKSDGTWIRTDKLHSDRESINMNGLPPGLYLYRIEGADGRFNGRVLVR